MNVDPRNFLLNTDYEMDKIIYFTEGELTLDSYQATIPHKLPFTPLIFGVCSYSPDFSDTKDIAFQEITPQTSASFTAFADAENINIYYSNTDTSKNTIYYRIYAFEPSDSSADLLATSNLAKEFVLNTDYNYCKLYKSGIVGGGQDTVIEHNFGYVPMVLAWGEGAGGNISPIEYNIVYDPVLNNPYFIGINEANVSFSFANAPTSFTKIHYRIYYDEA